MIVLIIAAVGIAVSCALGLLVVTLLDGLSESHEGLVPYGSTALGSEQGWWPDADEPVALELTDRGRVAVELPEVFLDETAETWGPAS